MGLPGLSSRILTDAKPLVVLPGYASAHFRKEEAFSSWDLAEG
jgi:hypothetical protein